jgi:hypothetical protein
MQMHDVWALPFNTWPHFSLVKCPGAATLTATSPLGGASREDGENRGIPFPTDENTEV